MSNVKFFAPTVEVLVKGIERRLNAPLKKVNVQKKRWAEKV